jgi:hypothetical protein
VNVALDRESELGTQHTTASFRSSYQTLCSTLDDIDFDSMYRELQMQLDRFTTLGSGWNLVRISEFTIHISHYRPLVGSSYIKSPKFIEEKRAVVNVQNRKDNKCFRWAILSALYPTKTDAHRLSKYEQF